ncbi:MAG: RNA polymerase sigma factor [Bacteroidales bacterium]|nr:RNA polymerase sigma factor [Bacteroidales bacterium]
MEDKMILDLFNNGEENQAFNLLVRTYGERLYWHLRHLVLNHDDADDLLQNTYMKAWGALSTFREESGLFTWLYRIATNEAITFLKKQRLRSFISFSSTDKQVERKLQGDPLFNGDKVQLALHKAISTLPPKQKAIFCIRYFNEMKYEEIAKLLDTSEGALKASYHHAYNKVVSYLKEELDDN